MMVKGLNWLGFMKLYIRFSYTGVGSNSIRTKKAFNSEHLNFPGKELNVTDITEQ